MNQSSFIFNESHPKTTTVTCTRKKKDLIKINILRETLDSYNSKITQNINNPLLHL